MMVSMVSVSCVLVALGAIVLLAGLVLLVKRMRLAGAVVALFGVCLILLPMLTVLYVTLVMR